MAEFTPVRIGQNFLAGQQAADDLAYNKTQNALGQQRLKANQTQLDDDQTRQFATVMVQAAQHGIQQQQPKAFIERHYPQLAELAGPQWAQLDDEGVRMKLQEAIGVFGPQAGVGPAPRPVQWQERQGPRGSILQVNPETNEMRQVIGPDNSQTTGGGPPSGYRFAPGGRLEPIPGGPADPNTPNTKDDSRIFAKADKLRDEFNTQSKDFIAVGDSYNVVKATAKDNSAAGDLSMIFAFMKMLDPTSVVRETEFANAQNAAGIPVRVQNAWNKALSGERLSPEQRADFIRQAENLYKTRKSRNDAIVKRYTEIAKRNRVNPDDVIGDMSVYESTAPTPEVTATGPNGQKLVLRNGQWVPL